MLERATIPLECTTHLLLKTLEGPTKSRRILGSSFWKHAGDNLDVPLWWPAYLHNLRKSADTTAPSSTLLLPLRSSTRATKRRETKHNARRPFLHTEAVAERRDNARTFTASAIPSQQQHSHNDFIEDESTDYLRSQPSQADIHQHAITEISSSASRDNLQQRSDEHSTEFDNGWRLFIQSGHKKELAAKMLHYLAQSKKREHLRHALTVFDFIPIEEREEVDYEIAIDVAMRCQSYRSAVHLTEEALSKSWAISKYFELLAHCVQHTLWNTLAILWRATSSLFRSMPLLGDADRKAGNLKFSGKYARHFDSVTNLAEKIVSLADRLSQKDAVLEAHRRVLIDVCKRLTNIAVESEKVMTTISGEGILALFNIPKKLKYDQQLHLSAIASIREMEGRASNSRLAMMIYRNFCFSYPDTMVPHWVYGSLIGICADAKESPQTYQFLLDEIARWHGRADDWSLQQVLAACARQGEVDAVFKIFADFCRVSKPKDLRDVNHLLHVFATMGDTANTQSQFDRLKTDFGFSPNIVSWSLLLMAHARSTHPETAFGIFNKMKEAGVEPNSISWSIIINVAAQKGDIDKARALYEQARSTGVAESVYMLDSIVESLLLNNDSKQAEKLVLIFSQVRRAESPIRLWNSLFRHYAFRSDSSSIHRIQELMEGLDVKPDSMTYAALMTAMVVRRQTSDAATILRTLQFSHHLHPTEFHYSILVHGFSLEGKREMATIVYNEMLQHFPRASASANLAMLQMQLRADFERKQPLNALDVAKSRTVTAADLLSSRSKELLSKIMEQDPRIEAASTTPSPGFRRQRARDGLEAIYLNSLVSFLHQQDAFTGTEDFLKPVQALASSGQVSPSIAIGTLTLRMSAASEAGEWSEVDELWREILASSLKAFTGLNEEMNTPIIESEIPYGSESPSTKQTHNIQLVGSSRDTFRPMIPASMSGKDNLSVLHAHRFAISRPLSLYLQALDRQRRYHDAVLTVQDLQIVGFDLSGRNWNRYIQIMSKSDLFDHQKLAFSLFEKHLLRFAPSWNIIRRGKWLPQQRGQIRTSKSELVPQSRSMLERRNPTLLMPSYFTMIHLAAALARSHRVMVSGNAFQMETLQNEAPDTVNLVREIPYLADRIQGVLIRNRPLTGDKVARARAAAQYDSFSGIKGSKSPLDNVPSSVLEALVNTFTAGNSIGTNAGSRPRNETGRTAYVTTEDRYKERILREEIRSGPIARASQFLPDLGRFESLKETRQRVEAQETSLLQPYLDHAQQIMGEILRDPQFLPAQGRLESPEEVQRRIRSQTIQRLDMIDQIRQDLGRPSLSHTPHRGEVPIETFPKPDIFAAEGNDQDLSGQKLMSTAVGDTIKALLKSPLVPGASSEAPRTGRGTSGVSRRTRASDTSALRRRISLVYRFGSSVPPVRAVPRRRGAWSINKALRRQRRLEQQEQARQDRRDRSIRRKLGI